MKPANLLFILSDQHNSQALGCQGHRHVRTPHLDALARAGVHFTTAYTPCPICVPARAALATGQYAHRVRAWDNAFPYDGRVASWHHRLRAAGRTVVSIGKLHFRSPDDDNGFSAEIDPLHVVEGQGDLLGCVRDDPPRRDKRPGLLQAGAGESTYLAYDRRNTARALRWLRAHREDEEPWALFLSYVCPHPPYIAPPRFFDAYPQALLDLPPQARATEWPDHPAIAHFRHFFRLAESLPETVLRNAMAAYYGACTFLDDQIGQVLQAVAELGLETRTRIIYTSDHGESHGARGLFGKFTLYDEACAVPLLMKGPDLPAGRREDAPVSLLDCFPTILDSLGVAPEPQDAALPGRSLFEILREPPPERTVFSEYHAVGSENAHYMLRTRRYKYMHYVGHAPMLFDMARDRQECRNLAALPAYRPLLQDFDARLRATLDPEATNQLAHQDQRQRIADNGGRADVIARGAFDNSPVPGERPRFEIFDA